MLQLLLYFPLEMSSISFLKTFTFDAKGFLFFVWNEFWNEISREGERNLVVIKSRVGVVNHSETNLLESVSELCGD